jgi:hypothetical protein
MTPGHPNVAAIKSACAGFHASHLENFGEKDLFSEGCEVDSAREEFSGM